MWVMSMKKSTGLLLFFLLLVLIAVSGCTGGPLPVTTPRPGELALQLSDLPEGYVKSIEGNVTGLDLPEEYRNLGLQDGYAVSFFRSSNGTDMTGITQIIAKFSRDRKDEILSATRGPSPDGDPGGLRVKRLTDLHVGEESEAYEVTTREDALVDIRFYTVTFVKEDVFETIMMTGTITDIGLLKDLAKLAETKIILN